VIEVAEDTLKPLAVRPGQAAKLLNISRTQVYRWIDKGILSTRTVGGCVLIPYVDIEAVLE
jgi:excisionase family DNA binding protein